jgi:3-methyladenine DNA glycosylase AlkC
MVSISSASEIKKRANKFFQKEIKLDNFDKSTAQIVINHARKEYDIIPEKERIGKGMVYITKILAKTLYLYIKKNSSKNKNDEKNSEKFIQFNLNIIQLFENFENDDNLRFAIHYASNFALDHFNVLIPKIEKWADHENWEIRENSQYPMLAGLKKFKGKSLEILNEWVDSKNENIRRFVAECLRPKAIVKWLRNPNENEQVLNILTKLNTDNSIYVRKSVGNNLKDLTKYMPNKIIDLIEEWFKEKDKLNKKEQNNLMWIIYQALRWLRKKEPKFHNRIERLVGKNYILYFDEKRNRWAKPP